MTDWFAASITELKSLLDHIGEGGSVTLEADSDGTAAIIAAVQAASVVALVDDGLHRTVAAVRLLQTEL